MRYFATAVKPTAKTRSNPSRTVKKMCLCHRYPRAPTHLCGLWLLSRSGTWQAHPDCTLLSEAGVWIPATAAQLFPSKCLIQEECTVSYNGRYRKPPLPSHKFHQSRYHGKRQQSTGQCLTGSSLTRADETQFRHVRRECI